MTTAASAALGRSRPSPPPNTRTATIATAPTTPAACVRAPDVSATAVRVTEALAGNPPNSPAPTFAAPKAAISAFGSTCSFVRAASVRERIVVSAIITKVMPTAATTRSRV